MVIHYTWILLIRCFLVLELLEELLVYRTVDIYRSTIAGGAGGRGGESRDVRRERTRARLL